ALFRAKCGLTQGVCAGALRPRALCQDGEWLDCNPSLYANHDARYDHEVEARCDGLDNDCDGLTDEDFSVTLPDGSVVTGVGQPCGVGACAGGFTVCDGPGGIVCSTA